MQEPAYAPLLRWYDQVKRDLPWRRTHDPYRIWLSEIMLQQTQVETVKAYYRRFLELFPTVQALAQAPEEQVLKAWEGLGYYSRARSLRQTAILVANDYQGHFPQTAEALQKLPGIGSYTAGAVASIAFGERVPAVDGNVNRVITRFYGLREDVGRPSVRREIARLALEAMPKERAGDFNQALMELGATLCTPSSPRCEDCPWQERCDAYAQGDMTLLPIHEKKRPQRVLPVAVCLLTCNDRVLVMKRGERLLKGLYVFDLIEEETQPDRVAERLSEQGLACDFVKELGTARHVFTHRIWEMTLLHYRLTALPPPEVLAALDARLVNGEELNALPLPSAMAAARKVAAELIVRL